jgi:hypothetical protein
MSAVPVSRDIIQEFGGYNHNLRINSNEFYDMKNLTGDNYPLLTCRKKRGMVEQLSNPNGLFSTDRLVWVDGTGLYYNGAKVATVKNSEKTIVSMGAYIVVWPDKICYNTYTGEVKNLEAEFETLGTTSFRLCKLDGEEYGEYEFGNTSPEDPENGDLWMDTSDTPHVLKQYSAASSSWASVPTTYVKISATGIGTSFAEYDCVTISGCTDNQFNSDMIIWGRGDDYIVVTAIIDKAFAQDGGLVLKRRVPDMDFVTQCNNRIWGCSSANHEIYACKLGDPTNWFCYMGLASDSYAATIGSEGVFTGACTHAGYVLFWKDNILHKVYGTQPSNFQVTDVRCRGVQGGSEKSLVSINGYLYYKNRAGVCRYDGSLPVMISDALAQDAYFGAVAGAVGNKYYISMKNASDEYSMFVYDTQKGLWHREDSEQARWFAYIDGDLYYINQNNQLMCVYASNGTKEEEIAWYAETGEIGLNYPDAKYISGLQLRLALDAGSNLRLRVKYDSSENWQEMADISSTIFRNYSVPIRVKRCDHMKIRLVGTGGFRLYSITKLIEEGSGQ